MNITLALIKSLTWRIIATTTTVLLVYYLTGELVLSLEVGVFEVSIKMVLYILHDKAWEKIIIKNNRIPPYSY